MPKHEIFHTAGKVLDESLKEGLKRFFEEEDLRKLERLGGRVMISLTSPYRDRKKKRQKVIINQGFLDGLKLLKRNPDELGEFLVELTVKELRELLSLMGHRTRTKANAAEIRAEVVRIIQEEDLWRGIAGHGAD